MLQADYILIAIPLAAYNIGGAATAETLVAELASLGFRCADIASLHRLKGGTDGALVQMDLLFERRGRQPTQASRSTPRQVATPGGVEGLLQLAQGFLQDGQPEDAVVLFEHLVTLAPPREDVARGLVTALGASGRNLEALERLMGVKALQGDPADLLSIIQEQSVPAIGKFYAHLQAGEFEQAEKYAAALVALVPHNPAMLRAAMSCNQALGRSERTASYARSLLLLEPDDTEARTAVAVYETMIGDVDSAAEHRAVLALTAGPDVHPLLRLRDLHDAASAILCRPLTPRGEQYVEQLLTAAKAVTVDVPAGSEWTAGETLPCPDRRDRSSRPASADARGSAGSR